MKTHLLSEWSVLAIMVIDNDPAILELLRMVLERHVLYSFGSGNDALEWFESHRSSHVVDLVISDCEMPGMSGMETIRRIRSFDPKSRCILMSGSSVEDVGALAGQ